MTREHPLILHERFARAVAEGTKTQHRLPLTSSSSYVDGHATPNLFRQLVFDGRVFVDHGPSPAGNPGPYLHVPHEDGDTTHRVYPRWWKGDVFWVKEAWYPTGLAFSLDRNILASPAGRAVAGGIRFQARGDTTPNRAAWEPANMLPRSIARTLLQVNGVRGERVDEVTELDARAEGYPCDLHPKGIDNAPCGCLVSAPRFRETWRQSTLARWCWTFELERIAQR